MNAKEIFELIATKTVPELGPERREGTETPATLNRKMDSVLKDQSIGWENEQLVRALVLLWHDHLNEAHTLAQEVESADGAFVHGIMHRREPDYGNAAYWFRRVGKHRSFGELGLKVEAIPQISSFGDIKGRLLPDARYDPFGFIDLCSGHARRSEEERVVLRQIQAIETRVLLKDVMAHEMK